MTEIELGSVWLNLASDLDDKLHCKIATLQRVSTIEGRTQRTAGGGIRMFRRAGAPVAWTLSSPFAPREEIDWYEDHKGLTITARDKRGNKMHGSYLVVPVEEYAGIDSGGIQLQLLEITHSEAV